NMRMASKFSYFLFDNGKRSFLKIQDGSVLGRSEGDHRFESDYLISRKHCSFYISGNEIYIEDFDSTNRTKVNGVPIQSGRKRRILLNDVIEIGLQRFVLTNQDKRSPGNLQDMPSRMKVYAARKKDDGSLTSS